MRPHPGHEGWAYLVLLTWSPLVFHDHKVHDELKRPIRVQQRTLVLLCSVNRPGASVLPEGGVEGPQWRAEEAAARVDEPNTNLSWTFSGLVNRTLYIKLRFLRGSTAVTGSVYARRPFMTWKSSSLCSPHCSSGALHLAVVHLLLLDSRSPSEKGGRTPVCDPTKSFCSRGVN